jgi:hypothetical protein
MTVLSPPVWPIQTVAITVVVTTTIQAATISEDEQDTDEALAALAEAEREGFIPWENIKTDLGL